MQDYYDQQDTNPTQEELFNEIHNLIDTSNHDDYFYEQELHPQSYHEEEVEEHQAFTKQEGVDYEQQYYQQQQQQQQQQQEEEEEVEEEDYVYERPILVESDSDEQGDDEEITTPDPYSGLPPHQPALCYHCCQSLTYDEERQGGHDTLTVEPPLCSSCAIIHSRQQKKKSKLKRPKSFTSEGLFGQMAGKIKQSVNFLSPGKSSMDRRKSMSSLEIPPISTTPMDASGGLGISRPSSRASSIIEDVKHFLSPIQGALSRKSSRTSLLDDDRTGPQRKSSHTSLLDAFNLCKPKPKQQTAFERRGFTDYLPEGTGEEDDDDDGFHLLDIEPYVPLRRKQIREVDALWERVEIYNRAFADCMESQTNVLPWIVKQSQKGPPDAYFGYIPPAREPRKIFGVFKVKPKVREEPTQQKLGIDISRISTPLRHQTSRNSVLSISSPIDYLSKPDEFDTMVTLEKPNAPAAVQQQPVSILKKKKSTCDDDYMNAPLVEEEEENYRQASYRSSSAQRPMMHHRQSRSSLYDYPPQRAMTPQHYPEDFYYRPRGYYFDPRDDFAPRDHFVPRDDFSPRDHFAQQRGEKSPRDKFVVSPRHHHPQQQQYHRRHHQHEEEEEEEEDFYDDVEEYDSQDEDDQRRGYYGNNIKMTPLRMEEWENALDILCDEFPRLDRAYLNDFLRSARGDFVTAKNMVMEMIMETNRRPLF
ncbi:hypothetical protein K501DRAFT_332226 [Backusella circina FSU 941]|nr:hypothetical protein K501DRAFT_332226 [Backusella circina FSU 941]